MTSKFLKINKLRIILAVIFFVLGVYGTFSFALWTSFGWDTTITDALLGGSTVLQLLSVGGITGLVLGNFLSVFADIIPVVVFIIIAGVFQLLWSYFLSCLIVFSGKKLFPR